MSWERRRKALYPRGETGLPFKEKQQHTSQRTPSLEEAWALLSQGNRSEAIHVLDEIVKTRPGDADARLLLGNILMEQGKRSESLAQLSEAVGLEPNSAKAQNALGEALNAFGDYQAALEPFRKAVALNPSYAPAQVNLGLSLLKSGEVAPATPHLDRAIALRGNNPDAAYPRYLRAEIDTERGQAKRTANDLEQAISLQPNFAEAWSDLGEARKTLLDNRGALAAFENAVKFVPDDPVSQTRLGSQLLEQGKAQQALPHLEQAVRLDPANQAAIYNLERALRETGRLTDAEAARKRLTALLRQKDQFAQDHFKAVQLNDRAVRLEKTGKLPQAVAKYLRRWNLIHNISEFAGITQQHSSTSGNGTRGLMNCAKCSRWIPIMELLRKRLQMHLLIRRSKRNDGSKRR